MRPTMSVAPPGGKTMTTRTGLVGYCCAHAVPHAKMTKPNTALNKRMVLMPLLPM
jgi:hypothetical protein